MAVVEQTITIRFRWTADELHQARRYHVRHICRPVFRIGLHCLLGFILLGGIFGLFNSAPSGKANFLVSLGFVAIGVYWFWVLPYERRWWIRRQFRKRPDRDTEIEWQFASDGVQVQSALAKSQIAWQAFAKMVQTPAGVMLYPNDQIFQWLPHHGFQSDANFRQFVELAKSKIQKCYEVT